MLYFLIINGIKKMNKNKKVAFIVDEYNENVFYGGGEKVNSYVIEELLKRDYKVDVFADVLRVKQSDKVNLFKINKEFHDNFENIIKNYDLVFSTNIEYPSEITYSHSHSFIWKKRKYCIFLKKLISKITKKKYEGFKKAFENAKKISKIVISSNIIKEDYLKNYKINPQKLFILPPGVDYREKDIKLPNKECFIFGLVGKSFTKKGAFLTLFSTFLLKTKCKNFKVKIINKDYYKKKRFAFLINMLTKTLGIAKYVEFLPLQDNMENFYKSIDCLLIPSLKEPFGLVVTEAMIYSKTVIVGSLCGAADFIIDNQNGMIADFSRLFKIKPLTDKMYKMMNLSNEEYISMAEKGYETVKDMSYEKFAKEYVDLAEKK